MMKTFLLAVAFLIGQTTRASVVTIEDHSCVPSSPDRIVQFVVDYANYSKIPEAAYSIPNPVSILKSDAAKRINMLSMTKSQAIRKNPSSAEDAIVFIELMPLNFGQDKKDLYPRFFIRCQVNHTSANSAIHECHSLTSADLLDFKRVGDPSDPKSPMYPFGVSSFHSKLEITGNSTDCNPGQSKMVYRLDLDINAADSDKIQSAYGIGAYPISEEMFFKIYYQHFYKGWIKGLTP